jgi:DNA-binding protein YbaB
LVQGGRNNLFDMSDDSDGVDDKSNRNEVSARQGGKNNIATVELRDESRANLVTISQLSSDSELVVRVDEGRRNTIDVIQAKGQVNNYAAVELFGSVLNEVSITQNGSDNVADLSIEEGSRGIFGDRNKVTITQELDGNDVGLLIEGNRNQFTAIQSNADSVDAILKGDLNQVSVTQELGGNIVTLTIEGSDNWFSATQGEASTIIAAQYGDANVMTLAQVGMNNAIYATQR